jgi:hypothetical protein
MDYTHDNVELSSVQLELGIRRTRIANLPPEVPDRVIRDSLTPFGDVKEITEESWSKAYRYKVSNGIRVATTCIRKTHTLPHVDRWQQGANIMTDSPRRATGVVQWATNIMNAPTVDN